MTYILKRAILAKLNYLTASGIKNVLYIICRASLSVVKVSWLKSALNRVANYYNTKGTQSITSIGSSYGYKKGIIKLSWAKNLDKIQFEDTEFLAFSNSKEYLAYFYGDYMKLPPINKRYDRHKIVEINFGKD